MLALTVSAVYGQDFEKKQNRFGIIFGGSTQHVTNHDELPEYAEERYTIGNIKLYYERFGLLGLGEDGGVGFDFNYVDSFRKWYPSAQSPEWYDMFNGRKIYISAYGFRDFDLGNVITAGLMAGPSLVVNTVSTNREDSPTYEGSASSMGIGIHTGQYILKYLGSGDKKKFCLRLGFEQYISINSGFTGLFGVGIGF